MSSFIVCMYLSVYMHAHHRTKGRSGILPFCRADLGAQLGLSGLVLRMLTRCAMLTVSFYNLYNSDNVDSSGLKKKVTGHGTVSSVLVILHNKIGINKNFSKILKVSLSGIYSERLSV